MNEYIIWKKIFVEKDEEMLNILLGLVTKDEKAKKLIIENILKLRTSPKLVYNIAINLDNAEDENILENIANEIVGKIKEEI